MIIVYDNFMSQSIKIVHENQKKRGAGRPRTGMDPVISARIPEKILAGVVKWAADNGVTRSEAIVRLLAQALSVKLCLEFFVSGING